MEEAKIPSKKFINDYQNVVPEALDGLCMLNSKICRIEGTQIVTLKNPRTCVNVICGGGSGHEPAHAGFVCENILSAAVCGGVFASPSYQDVLKAIVHVANENGVLVIVKNYTGDCINFELAADIARTKGIKVMTLHVADDISLGQKHEIGRRGLAGTVLLYKILGAAATSLPLEKLHELGTSISKNLYTIGISFSACSIPGYPPMYTLGPDEMEIGLGIHGEKGLVRKKVMPCNAIIEEIYPKFASEIKKRQEVVALVNNLGSCTDIEMMIIVSNLIKKLNSEGIILRRIIEGKLMSSLEMHGMSITLLALQESTKDFTLQCLDAPVDCKHWKISEPSLDIVGQLKQPIPSAIFKERIKLNEKGEAFKKILRNTFKVLQGKELLYNQLDADVGDGDLGFGVAKTTGMVLNILDFLPLEEDIVSSFQEIGEIMAQGFGGTTGPLYAFFLLAGSKKLMKKLEENTLKNWFEAFDEGIKAIQRIGKAEIGDRTMLDALNYAFLAFGNELKKGCLNAKEIALIVGKEAKKGAEEASKLKAKRGRSSYLQGKEIGKKDPGCELVAEWINLIANEMQ